MTTASLASKVFFLLSASFQVFGTFTADWSASHIYNTTWPPHAKFHTGQTISMSVVLATLGLYYAFRPKASTTYKHSDLLTATLFLDVYWVTQACAFFVPGTHWCDEGFCFESPFPPQIGVEIVGLMLNGIAYGLGRRAMTVAVQGKKAM